MNNLKILIIGDSGVGKSCIFTRYIDDYYDNAYPSTIGVDFRIKNIMADNISLFIWDVAGHNKFKPITTSYYYSVDYFILVFDLSDPPSLYGLQKWISDIKQYIKKISCKIILVGNKSDSKKIANQTI